MFSLFVDEQQFYVFVDALLYVCTLLFFLWKKKTINAGIFFLLIMTISHVGAIFYYNILNNLGFALNITMQPFIYLYLTIMISIFPFIKYDGVVHIEVGRNKNIIIIISYIFFLVSLIPLVENILILLSKGISSDFASVYEDKMAGELKIYSFVSTKLNALLDLLKIFFIGVLFYVLSLIKNKSDIKKYKYELLSLIFCLFNYLLTAINISSRASLLSILFVMCGCFLFLRHIMSNYIVRFLKKISLVVIGIVIIFMTYITLSRFSSKGNFSVSEWVMLYISEGPIKFNNEMWSADHNTNGDVNITLLKNIWGEKTFMTYEDRDEYYKAKNGRRIEVFYTFVGDFLSDFDYEGAVICCLLLLSLGNHLIKNKNRIGFEAYILVVFLIQLYTIGFASNIFRSVGKQKAILFTLCILGCMYIYRNWKKKKEIT